MGGHGAVIALTVCDMNLITLASGRLLRAMATLLLAAGLASPAHAAGSVALPDPSGLTLFSLGLAGLILGRRAASRRNKDD